MVRDAEDGGTYSVEKGGMDEGIWERASIEGLRVRTGGSVCSVGSMRWVRGVSESEALREGLSVVGVF